MKTRLLPLAVALVALLSLVSCTVLHEQGDKDEANPEKKTQRTIIGFGGTGTHAKVKYHPGGLIESNIFAWDNRESFKDATNVPITQAIYQFGASAAKDGFDFATDLTKKK